MRLYFDSMFGVLVTLQLPRASSLLGGDASAAKSPVTTGVSSPTADSETCASRQQQQQLRESEALQCSGSVETLPLTATMRQIALAAIKTAPNEHVL